MIAFDSVAAGSDAAGPTTNTLTTPWAQPSNTALGLALAGFTYDTTSPNSRSIGRTVTYGGQPMTMLVQQPKGYWPYTKGAPGYVELWAAAIDATGNKTISAGLAYNVDADDAMAPASATFSNFRGGSIAYSGIDTWGPVSGHSSANKWISIPVSAFMNTLTIGVVGTETPIDPDSVNHDVTVRFLDASQTLAILEKQGPGAFKLQGGGGPWAAATVNLRPITNLAANVGTGIIW
jgi:hypothetical protein